jgi:preprotein translocase subunit SecG
MTTILLVLQIFIVIALIVAILVQKTSSDGLSGLSGGGHNFMSGKSINDAFSKMTMFLGAAFMINSLLLAKIVVEEDKAKRSLVESIVQEKTQEPVNPGAPIAK